MARIAVPAVVASLLMALALCGCGGGTNLAFCSGNSSLNSPTSSITVNIDTGQCPSQTATATTAAAQAPAAPLMK